jgi:hypothetical protein
VRGDAERPFESPLRFQSTSHPLGCSFKATMATTPTRRAHERRRASLHGTGTRRVSHSRGGRQRCRRSAPPRVSRRRGSATACAPVRSANNRLCPAVERSLSRSRGVRVAERPVPRRRPPR